MQAPRLRSERSAAAKLHTPILRGVRVDTGDWPMFPESGRRQAAKLDSVHAHEVVPDRLGAALRKRQVVGVRTGRIGMSFDHD